MPLRPSVAVLVACLAGLTAAAPLAQAPAPRATRAEIRALWVARTSLTSPRAVEEMVSSARAAGFNTLLVQVRGRGDAYFADGMEPRAATLASQPESFDPLARTLALARPLGLHVHAWVNVNLVSSAADLPSSREHVVYRHPEWLMVPREIARDMSLLNPKSLLYLDKLARWARSQPGEIEGLYLSPIPAGAADRTVQVIADLVTRYPVDGLHLDYVRYPSGAFDYSREALEAFRDSLLEGLDARERQRRGQAIGADIVRWAERHPAEWEAFRRARLTALVSRIRESLARRRPGALLSAAVYPDAARAASERLQDWSGWIDRRLLDVVCPMAYATDADAFTEQLTAAKRAARDLPVWAGIGAYRLSTEQTIENIRIARRLGASGVVLFSYDSLVASPKGPGYLSQVSRAVFGG
ncbi:MAG TPA: family 10 glycosylhydrolase [Vicinamibacterales bacterium]|nr:family 10 glycosylhydrolase [Acidobacteriota bacterium]HOC18258.1 family 10 glycosylhydrolase [Vicinamibacterales bacterium]